MRKIKSWALAGVIALPLHQPGAWQVLQYSSIKPNEVSFTERGMQVSVDGSASPVIFPLHEPIGIRKVEVKGRLSNLLALSEESQGLEGGDDYCLKVGLVIAGDKTLNAFQRMFSARWVKTLFELAPAGTGIDRIQFLNAVQSEALLGRRRQHPLAQIIHEENVWLLDRAGDFELSHTLGRPERVIAIWLSIDGDDSASKYTTLITSLVLEQAG
ncbi:MAG: hypothetical protein OEO19_12270 [Gammaproteobacteria bacterium]|nr:hypothetical protein [Gammaproteobacteria bacterium]MDH3447945.1 hypothetical protein [Gammaproteobacteria bacterium]